jgi:glycosyltransferase involved in cell wall biosynthesis
VRVLHLLGSGQPGGVESFVLQLVRDIPRSEAKIAVCIIGPDGPVAEAIRDAGCRVSHGMRGLMAQLASEPPEIVHANSGGRSHRLIARLSRAHLINHLHGIEEDWLDDGWKLRPGFGRKIVGFAQGSDEIAVSSAWMENLVKETSPPRPVVRLDYGVDLGRFSPSVQTERRPITRNSLGIAPDDFTVGFVGRLVTQKGIDVMLHLARELRDDESIRLVLAGDGPLASSVAAEVASNELHNVMAVGKTMDTPSTMAAFDVVVMPSRWEPFGIVAIEAAAMGIPVAAFAVGGIPESVIDGQTGLLFPPGDVAGLASGIRALKTNRDLGARLGHGGRLRTEHLFSSDAQSGRILQHYRRITRSAS